MIQFSIYDFTGPGTYTLTDTLTSTNPYPTTPVAVGGYQTGSIPSSPAVYGTITITETSPDIVGTFSFTTADSIKVANGKFTARPE